MRPAWERGIDRVGTLVLLVLAVALLCVFGFLLGAGGSHQALARGEVDPLGWGASLGFLLVAGAAVLLRDRFPWITALPARRVGPYLPLLIAAALVALVFYFSWYDSLHRNWDERVDAVFASGIEVVETVDHGDGTGTIRARIKPDALPPATDHATTVAIARAVGAVLIAAVAFAGLLLLPRAFMTMAAAVAGPLLFFLVADAILEASGGFRAFLSDSDHRGPGVVLLPMLLFGAPIGAVLCVWLGWKHPRRAAPWVAGWMATLAVVGIFTYPFVRAIGD